MGVHRVWGLVADDLAGRVLDGQVALLADRLVLRLVQVGDACVVEGRRGEEGGGRGARVDHDQLDVRVRLRGEAAVEGGLVEEVALRRRR